MKAYSRAQAQHRSVSTSALDSGQQSVSLPGRYTPGGRKPGTQRGKSAIISRQVVVPWGNHDLISNSRSQYDPTSRVTERKITVNYNLTCFTWARNLVFRSKERTLTEDM